MFGITFAGHPDLRRLLMWEQYKEGYPLRKDFPLRGRFSRSEQLRQALAAESRSALLEGRALDRRRVRGSARRHAAAARHRRDGRESSDGDHETHGRSRALDHGSRCAGPAAARAARRRRGGDAVDRSKRRRRSSRSSTGEHMLINIGPQHPATHGVLRLVLELDGETVVRCIPHIGYLHCGFEKIGEYRQYNQIIPWTDREDYLNSPGNNVAFALGAERLFGIEITERCKVLRVMACEMSRIISHLVWLGTTCIDIGAFTPFLWAFQQRERSTRCSSRGSARGSRRRSRASAAWRADIPDGWIDELSAFVSNFPKVLDEIDRIITRNGIWVGRTVGLGVMSPEEAINYGLSGPDASRLRRRLRRPQGFPVPRLRDVRLRRPGRHEWRRLRSLSSFEWKRCGSRCASSSRRSSDCPTGR